jgi:hypothetical protein
MIERWSHMTPEEREKFRESMRTPRSVEPDSNRTEDDCVRDVCAAIDPLEQFIRRIRVEH